jgi:hypothetical protein
MLSSFLYFALLQVVSGLAIEQSRSASNNIAARSARLQAREIDTSVKVALGLCIPGAARHCVLLSCPASQAQEAASRSRRRPRRFDEWQSRATSRSSTIFGTPRLSSTRPLIRNKRRSCLYAAQIRIPCRGSGPSRSTTCCTPSRMNDPSYRRL